jgi:hypothetical protein
MTLKEYFLLESKWNIYISRKEDPGPFWFLVCAYSIVGTFGTIGLMMLAIGGVLEGMLEINTSPYSASALLGWKSIGPLMFLFGIFFSTRKKIISGGV